MTLRHVSLFTGIGGIDLGLHWAGIPTIGQVENNDWCVQVLERHWPTTPRLRDVHDFRGWEFGEFDLLSAGYPCQPFSIAGKRSGTADPRHLWPEAYRIIRAVRPPLILLENVPGHLSLGFGRVQGDLAQIGYDTEWACIPASSVGAPHLRYRVFILAYPNRDTLRHQPKQQPQRHHQAQPEPDGQGRHVAHPQGHPQRPRLRQDQQGRQRRGRPSHSSSTQDDPHTHPQRCPETGTPHQPQGPGWLGSLVPHHDRQGRPYTLESQTKQELARTRSTRGADWWATEPSMGRVADGVPSRVDKLTGLGNAVVPHVAYAIGRAILETWGPT